MPRALLALLVVALTSCCDGCRTQRAPELVVVSVDAAADDENDPAGVERTLAVPIEEHLRASGAASLRSVSTADGAVVTAHFAAAAAADRAYQSLRDLRAALPQSAVPQVARPPATTTVRYVLSSPTAPLAELTRSANDVVRDRLQREPGVTSVTLCGGAEDRLVVTVDPKRLAAAGMSFGDLVHDVGASRSPFVANKVPDYDDTYSLGSLLLKLRAPAGSFVDGPRAVRLSDVARVAIEPERTACQAFLDGAPALLVDVDVRYETPKLSLTSALESASAARPAFLAAKKLESAIAQAQAQLPPSVTLRHFDVAWRAAVDISLFDEPTQRTPPSYADLVPRVSKQVPGAIVRRESPSQSTLQVLVPPAPTLTDDDLARMLAGVFLPSVPLPLRRLDDPERDVIVVVTGPEIDTLDRLAAALTSAAGFAADVVAAAGVDGGFIVKPELRITVDRERATELGIKPADVHLALQAALGGVVVDKVTVKLERPEGALSPSSFAALSVPLRDGHQLFPLDMLLKIEERTAPRAILRIDGQRALEVWARPRADADAGDVRNALADAVAKLEVPAGYAVSVRAR